MAVSRTLDLTVPSFRDRIRQGLSALRPRKTSAQCGFLSNVLTQNQNAAFGQLSSYDRAHLCRVYELLCEECEDDRDVLVAALLHDVGKVGESGRVRLVHRVARVVLARLLPHLLARLARLPAPAWRSGLALAVHHPKLGAEQAAVLGCSPRTCWLIAHHEDQPLPDDEQLRRLVAADHAA